MSVHTRLRVSNSTDLLVVAIIPEIKYRYLEAAIFLSYILQTKEIERIPNKSCIYLNKYYCTTFWDLYKVTLGSLSP
jgi:hypothetical protein